MSDRRNILELLSVNARLSVVDIAMRSSPGIESDFDYRRRAGWALGWLRRAGLVERLVLTWHGRPSVTYWSITNEGRSSLDGRCSATVFRSHQEGRCTRRATRAWMCRQHAEAMT